MGRFEVTRCICHNRSFREIRTYAKTHGIDAVEDLQAAGFCSNSCGLCAPYVEMVLETGETSFEPGAHYRKKKRSDTP